MTSTTAGSVFHRLSVYLKRNPGLSVYGRVYNGTRYTYNTAPDVELTVEGDLAIGQDYSVDPQLGPLVDQVQEAIEEWVHDFGKKMEEQLYKEMEYHQSEESLSDSWDANAIVFDEEGDMVTQVRAGQRVRTGLKFSELSPEAKEHALDKYRYWNTEDSFWSEYLLEDFEKQLEYFGFEGIEVQYSLGYGQGDGACFTAKNIDVAKFLERSIAGAKPEDVFNAPANESLAHRLVEEMLA